MDLAAAQLSGTSAMHVLAAPGGTSRPSVPDISFRAGDFPEGSRREAWLEQFAPIFDAAPAGAAPRGFEADLEVWHLGELLFVHARLPGIRVHRRERQVRSDGLDHWMLTASCRDVPLVAGRSSSLRVDSLDRPFDATMPANDVVLLFISRDFLREACPHIASLSGVTLTTALARMSADFLLDLAQRMPELGTPHYAGLLGGIRAMVAAGMAASEADRAGRQQASAMDTTIVEKARQLIQQRLRASSLGVDELCCELGVSRSRLYRLFEPLGGVVHYIRHRRLLDAHVALASATERRPIGDIAAERGFIDPAEFSRAFKREFGYRPSEVRGGGSHPPPASPLGRLAGGATLAGYLQNLR